MVKIRLMRMGAKKRPFFRVVVADSRSPRDGRFIENIGKYHPLEDPSLIEIDADRALHWLSNGAQPTEAVTQLLRIQGVWAKFAGAEAPPGKAGARTEAARRAAAAATPPPEAPAAEAAAAPAPAPAPAAAPADEPVEESASEAAPEEPPAEAQAPAPQEQEGEAAPETAAEGEGAAEQDTEGS